MVPVCMTFPRTLKVLVDAAAEADGRTRSGFVRKVLTSTLEQNPATSGFNPCPNSKPASPGRRAAPSAAATPGRTP